MPVLNNGSPTSVFVKKLLQRGGEQGCSLRRNQGKDKGARKQENERESLDNDGIPRMSAVQRRPEGYTEHEDSK